MKKDYYDFVMRIQAGVPFEDVLTGLQQEVDILKADPGVRKMYDENEADHEN